MPTGTEKQCAYREPSPATETDAVPFARWLHKGESHSSEAADLKKPCASFPLIITYARKSRNQLNASDSTRQSVPAIDQGRSPRLPAISDPHTNP